jgi:AcrR family transcriptional regulator
LSPGKANLLTSRHTWLLGVADGGNVTATHHTVRDDTRTRILDTALELIAEKGFAGTSTRELSERLGFTKAALYYHFRTKDDLLEALIAPGLDDLAALVGGVPTRTSAAARRQLLARYVDLVSAHQTLIQVLSQDPSVVHRPALQASAELYVRLTELLAGQDLPDTCQRAWVRASLGGIHAALLHAAPGDDPELVREAALIAGCRALGIPAPTQELRSEDFPG